MAIDEALLSSKLPVLRLYQWEPPCLSIGYFQQINQINKEFCKKNNIDIVRRLTGGNAVLHDKELTYSFIIDEKLMPKSVIDSYKKISKGLLSALTFLGLKPEMNNEVKKEEKSPICFNDPGWYEILINKKKIIGSAQKRVNGKLLQHGAILIDIDIKRYANCFRKSEPEKLKQRITSINKELKEETNYKNLAKTIKKGFESALKIGFQESELTKEERKLAERLNKEKYSTDKWNLMR